MDNIDRFERLIFDESQVLKESRKFLGDTYYLIVRIDEFYQYFISQICSTNLGFVDNQLYAFLNCVHACNYEYLISSATVMRGHSVDSYNHGRRALEFCAFGIEVFRCPDAAKIWLESGTSNNAGRRYKDYFKIMKLIAKATDFIPDIKKQYSLLSEYMVHASYSSVFKRAKLTEDRKFQYKFFDIADSDESYGRMVFDLLNILELHLNIIKAFQCVISHRDTSFDHQSFYKIYSPLIYQTWQEKIDWIPKIAEAGIDLSELEELLNET